MGIWKTSDLASGSLQIWCQRELEDGDRGDLDRLQTHAKYGF